ncbi:MULTISPECIES: response regulator transcription factor [Streptomyces]|uniref:response regulator transcription factor n=1 Tax=Streptomyces TaxID=1883 RepID=UPI0004C7CFC3|nr:MULTISPECIES: helix-turn-helix transcriptional regulator [Streptomyces]
MRVVSFSVPTWFPSYEEPGGPPAPHEGLPAEALLTEQESAVFLCLATGASNRELAVELQLSVSTVKFHVVNIRAKLGGISRLQACLLAALARQGGRPADIRPADDRPADDRPAGDAPAAERDAGPGAGAVSDGGEAAVPR